MNILFLGPQGSGKGTQAHLLKDILNLQYFDMGAFLRESARENSILAEKLGKGELLSDDLVISLVRDYIQGNDLYDNMVYDGFPRRLAQLYALEELLKEKGKKIDYTVYLYIPEDITISRLSARRIHKITGEIYNLITNPPGQGINEADLYQRNDDKPEAIKERLKEYHSDTEPLITRLKQSTKFIEVDGTKSIEKIHQEIMQKLSEQ